MKTAVNTWINLVSQQDIDRVVDLYAEDGVLLGTFSNEIRVGKQKIREYFKFFLAKKPKALVGDFKMHIIDQNSFTVNGFYDFEVDSDDGEREFLHARFTFIFQKIDNDFKILSHHSSVVP